MTFLSDVQLIENYQDTNNENYILELHGRYKFFLKKHSYRIYGKFKKFSNAYSIEDIESEVNIAFLEAVQNINRDKIRNKNYFCISVWIGYYIKVFERKNCAMILQNEIDYNRECNFISNNNLYKMNHILKEFKKNLNEKEKNLFNYRLQGLSLKEIADEMNLTRVRISQIHLKIKRKYKEFIKKV